MARSLEARWEARLAELAEAQAALAVQTSSRPELPSPEQLAATVADLPTLWAAPTTSDKDRKRLLRTLLGDVTITPSTQDNTRIDIGLRWKSGATQQIQATRRRNATQLRNTDPATIALARSIGPDLNNAGLAAALNAAAHTTGTGHPFDTKAASNLRHAYRIASPATLTDGELTPRVVAARLKTSTSTVHEWLTTGQLPARRARGGHWAITFTPDIEAACQQRLAASGHIHRDTDNIDRQPGELSIAQTATQLGVKADVVYYRAHRGYLPTRRGTSGRRWVTLTPELEADCRHRIANSYKPPDHVKSQNPQPAERIAV